MKIAAIRNYSLQMSFIPSVAANMRRATTHTERMTVYRVELDNGIVGWGDSHGAVDLSEHVGRHAMELLHGTAPDMLRMACFDAVGKTLEVPAHVLMGEQQRPRIPFAYWTIDCRLTFSHSRSAMPRIWATGRTSTRFGPGGI
ncbi:MAG: hypothetical protein O3B95_13190 [Chloroflexi bacterium]|nr:hypothetical protein [Chloroflexota bacterium]